MNKLFSKIATLSVGLAMAVGVGVALGHEGVREVKAAISPTDYTLITSVSSLSNGDKAVLYNATDDEGVTGTSGTKDAAVGSTGWLEYTVAKTTNGFTLEASSGTYVVLGTKSFSHGSTGTDLSVTSDGYICTVANSDNILYHQSSYVRTYTGKSGDSNYHPFAVYKVNEEGPDPSLKSMTIKQSGSAAEGSSYLWSSSVGLYVFVAEDEDGTVSGVAWSVSDTTIANINSSTGALTCVKPGNVTVYAEATGYNKSSASISIIKGSLEELVVTGSMTKTSYYVGESWNPAGLVVTASYHSGWEADVTSEVEWSYNPASPALNVTSVVATATLSGEDPVSSPAQAVNVTRTNPIQVLYTKSSGASVDVYGVYVGFLDGTGPVIMDGAYGIVVYNKTADVSGYTEGTTILHVTGSISIYKGLYEIGSATISVASGTYDAPETPVVYATAGGETADYASRLTTVTGTPSLVSGSFDDAAGTADIKMNFAFSDKTIQVFYKKAAQTADAEAFAAIKAAVTNSEEITIKGFTGWYDGFQVQMNGYVKPAESYTAEDFAQDLLDQTDAVCTGWKEGDNNHDALVAIWSNLAANDKYPSLPTAQKTILAEAERDESGTVVEQAMARYDFLTGKYNLSNFINGRTPIAVAGSNFAPAFDDNNSYIIIVVISAVSVMSFGLALFLRKKRSK